MRKILSSQRGITLTEILATLVIMTIVSGVIYGVFTAGLKLYQKTGIEAQLRDDADYAATMLLNEMYNNPPNYITQYKNESTGAVGIELVRYKQKNVEGYLVEDSTEIEQDLLIYFEQDHLYMEQIKRPDDGSEIQSLKKTEIASEGSRFTSIDDGASTETSTITYDCTQSDTNGKCQHGRIQLTIVIDGADEDKSNFLETEPLVLKSSFGF